MTEFHYIEEIVAMDEQEWQRLTALLRVRPYMAQGLLAAEQFKAGIRELERTVGESREQVGEISRAILEIAEGKEDA